MDDGSTDGTAAELAGLPLTLISNPANLGKGASLWRGFALALAEGADAVVTLDGDAQHRPEDIPRLVRGLAGAARRASSSARGCDDRANVPPLRYFGNRFANFWVAWAAGFPVARQPVGLSGLPSVTTAKI